ncbi:unnamed protein product [Prorocentrum cordatum]|uniref:Uncharacterized protein n=1 Tax=Prorocentrum cordatum TaxID=2364126 RepID=A0ABN9VB12_9DINO|nr:unnamed protein product [Polarella glacialis]
MDELEKWKNPNHELILAAVWVLSSINPSSGLRFNRNMLRRRFSSQVRAAWRRPLDMLRVPAPSIADAPGSCTHARRRCCKPPRDWRMPILEWTCRLLSGAGARSSRHCFHCWTSAITWPFQLH